MYDWVLRTRPDMYWTAPPQWASLLALRVPKIYASHDLCTDCVQLIPAEQAETLLSIKSRIVCGFPDGSVVGGGGGAQLTVQDKKTLWAHRGPRTACCNHFEGFHTECVLNGTARSGANFPAVLLRHNHYNASCTQEQNQACALLATAKAAVQNLRSGPAPLQAVSRS